MRNTLTEEYKTFIGNWAAFCKRVAEAWHGSPTDRYVVFYLNIRSLETLKDMVEPLKQLPRLRQYAVRFNDFKDQVSYYGMPIIKKTLCSLQSKWDEAKPFRYMDLPEEVQLKILSFTTLVNLHDGIPSACYRCLGRRRNDFCCNDCVFHVEYGKCCCHVVGIVGLYSKQYKAYSTSCSCYRHPLELFRVSKHIYRQSLLTLYSANHFIFIPKRFSLDRRESLFYFRCDDDCTTSIIPPVIQMWKDSIRFIRSVELTVKKLNWPFGPCRRPCSRPRKCNACDRNPGAFLPDAQLILEKLKEAGCRGMKILFRVDLSYSHKCSLSCKKGCLTFSLGPSDGTNVMRDVILEVFEALSVVRPILVEIADAVLVRLMNNILVDVQRGHRYDPKPLPESVLPLGSADFAWALEQLCEKKLMGEEYKLDWTKKKRILEGMRDSNYDNTEWSYMTCEETVLRTDEVNKSSRAL